jgi:hypothetical protein
MTIARSFLSDENVCSIENDNKNVEPIFLQASTDDAILSFSSTLELRTVRPNKIPSAAYARRSGFRLFEIDGIRQFIWFVERLTDRETKK